MLDGGGGGCHGIWPVVDVTGGGGGTPCTEKSIRNDLNICHSSFYYYIVCLVPQINLMLSLKQYSKQNFN